MHRRSLLLVALVLTVAVWPQPTMAQITAQNGTAGGYCRATDPVCNTGLTCCPVGVPVVKVCSSSCTPKERP